MVFAMTRFVPGGPLEQAMMDQFAVQGEGSGATRPGGVEHHTLDEDKLEQLAAYYGFDMPWYQAYFVWLGKVLQLDLGHSTSGNQAVWTMIADVLPISTYYGLMTLFLTYGICIPLGIVKAIRHQSAMDTVSSIVVFIGYAIPGYVVGIVLLVFLAGQLEWFPLGEFVSEEFDDLTTLGKVWDIIHHSVLPLAAYMAGSFAVLTFMTKNSLMEHLAADYVRTAMAKGQTFKRTVFRHALRNSLIPLATHFGNNISLIISGSFLIEKIFTIEGFGKLGYDALIARDYPTVMGILVLSSILFLIGNILSDICVALVDPRIKYT